MSAVNRKLLRIAGSGLGFFLTGMPSVVGAQTPTAEEAATPSASTVVIEKLVVSARRRDRKRR